jgi:hypothetical protein
LGSERRVAARKLADLAARFPRLKRDYAEALTVLADENPDLATLKPFASRRDDKSGAESGAVRTRGGWRGRAY